MRQVPEEMPDDEEAGRLKRRIIRALRKQGMSLKAGRIVLPDAITKDQIRNLHSMAVKHKIAEAEPHLRGVENRLLKHIAHGTEITPEKISPRLIQVERGTEEELLFRYAALHWSIPVSSGYGRRLRFIVEDASNGKLIGLIGLGDPVFSLKARDEWIGWSSEQRRHALRYVMDAYVLGAVPPYSKLLCGKLVAMLAATTEVRMAFSRKYRGVSSLIADRTHDGRLVLLGTTSALGTSSVYNRLKTAERTIYQSVGATSGFGEFQFYNGVYESIREYVDLYCEGSAKRSEWGTGFRNRREVVRKCLASLGMSLDLMNHGIQREVFAIPLARNATQFLCGHHTRVQWFNDSAESMSRFFLDRWLLPRAASDHSYREFQPEQYRLWSKR